MHVQPFLDTPNFIFKGQLLLSLLYFVLKINNNSCFVLPKIYNNNIKNELKTICYDWTLSGCSGVCFVCGYALPRVHTSISITYFIRHSLRTPKSKIIFLNSQT